MTKKAVLINDLSGLGKCSLTASIPVLSVMGVQPCPVATAVLTNQTGFESFYCNDCTDSLEYYIKEWKKIGFVPNGIYTGFLSNEKQVDKILDFISAFSFANPFILVDPVMGDNGKTYSLFTETLALKMKTLVSRANIITPNLTECCILCDYNYDDLIKNIENDDYLNKVERLGQTLLYKYKVDYAVVTGIQYKEKIYNLAISKNECFYTKSEKIGESYSGTGDLLASVVFAGLLKGEKLYDVLNKAVDFIEKSIADTVGLNISRNEGIEFEKNLGMLIWGDKNEK